MKVLFIEGACVEEANAPELTERACVDWLGETVTWEEIQEAIRLGDESDSMAYVPSHEKAGLKIVQVTEYDGECFFFIGKV